MATTRGYPFPTGSNLPNVPYDLELLAEAVDADVQGLYDLTTDWATWNPSVVGLTLGNGTQVANYRIANGACEVEFTLTGGSTTVFIANLAFTIPVAAKGAATLLIPNQISGTMRDGTGGFYPIQGAPLNSTSFRLATTTAVGTVGATTPFVFGDGDTLAFSGRYAI